jgi:hypothetical protein
MQRRARLGPGPARRGPFASEPKSFVGEHPKLLVRWRHFHALYLTRSFPAPAPKPTAASDQSDNAVRPLQLSACFTQAPSDGWEDVLTDFILFVAVTIAIINLALGHIISFDLSAEMLGAFVLIVAALRSFGSTALKKAKAPKVVLSLAPFAWSLAQEDVSSAVPIAAAIFCGALCMFGIYYIFSGLFPTSKS